MEKVIPEMHLSYFKHAVAIALQLNTLKFYRKVPCGAPERASWNHVRMGLQRRLRGALHLTQLTQDTNLSQPVPPTHPTCLLGREEAKQN